MLIDIHTHTRRYSDCGKSEPAEMVAAAQEAGLDGLVFTEHHIMWPEDEAAALQAQFPKVHIFRAIEITCDEGDDFLVYGILQPDTLYRKMPAQELLNEVARLGGAVILAHPYRYRDVVPEAIVPGSVTGIETMSKNIHQYAHQRAVQLAQTLGTCITVASDGHHRDHLGLYALDFEDWIADEHALAEALRQGRFALSIGDHMVGARNAWLDELLPKVDEMIAQGASDRAIHKAYPELTFTLIEHHREGLDVHWAAEQPNYTCAMPSAQGQD